MLTMQLNLEWKTQYITLKMNNSIFKLQDKNKWIAVK